MPIQMTAAEYQAKYGTPPPQPIQPQQMTQQQYQDKYGKPVSTSPFNPNTANSQFTNPNTPSVDTGYGAAASSVAKSVGNFATKALPTIGSIAGGIGGAALGGLAAGPSVFGIPAGAYAGGVAGATAGGAAGEAAKEKIQGGPVSGGQVAKIGGEFGAMEAIGGPVFSAAGKAIEGAGEGLAKMFIPKSDAEAGMLQAYKAASSAGSNLVERMKSILGVATDKAGPPSTAASTAFEKGIAGPESWMGVQAKRVQTKLWDNLIQPALKASQSVIKIPDFLKEAENRIISENVDPTRQKVLLNALDSIKKDFGKAGEYSLEQLQKLKEGWAKFVPEKSYKGQPIAGALNDVRATLADMARQKIYTELGDNVKQAYFDYGNLEGIKALGRKATTATVKGGFGTTVGGLLEKAIVPISTIGGQIIYGLGKGIEMIGAPGARTLRDIVLGVGQNLSSQSGPSQQSNTQPQQPTQ